MKAYVMVWNSKGHIQFGKPLKFNNVPEIRNLQSERYQPLTISAMRSTGARKYAWVTAADNVKRTDVSFVSKFINYIFSGGMQGFAFTFDEDEDNVFFAIESGLGITTWLKIGAGGVATLVLLVVLAFLGHRYHARKRERQEQLEAEAKKKEILGESPSQAELTQRQRIANTRKSLVSLQQLGQSSSAAASLD